MRTLRLAAAFSLLAALTMPGSAVASPPIRSTETITGFECRDLVVTDDGALAAFAVVTDQGFTEGGIAYWTEAPPPGTEVEPTLSGGTGSVVLDGLTLSADEVPLFAGFEGEEIVGAGSIEATLTLTGETESFGDQGPHFKVEGMTQLATVSGSVTLEAGGILAEPITFNLESCVGFITEQTIFEVQPTTFQDFHDEARLRCDMSSETAIAGLNAFVFTFDDEFAFGSLGLFVEPNDPLEPVLVGGVEGPALTVAGIDATFPVSDAETGDVAGEAVVSATFEVTDVLLGTRVAQDYVQKMIVTLATVSGSLVVTTTADITYEFDLADCTAEFAEFHSIFHDPSGPKPGGKVPANDTPDGAVPLEPGDRIQMQTGGASIASEAPCFLDFDGEVFEDFLGYTVWFTIEGTGEPITIDPAGSNFDTVVAAYVDGADGLEHLACAEDEFGTPFQNPQAQLTIETELGTTYFIQVGGFDLGPLIGEESQPEFGRLRLAVY
jgi:hypothetical protein